MFEPKLNLYQKNENLLLINLYQSYVTCIAMSVISLIKQIIINYSKKVNIIIAILYSKKIFAFHNYFKYEINQIINNEMVNIYLRDIL